MKLRTKIKFFLKDILPVFGYSYARDMAHMIDDVEALEDKIVLLVKFNTQLLIALEGFKTSDAQHTQLETIIMQEFQAINAMMNGKKIPANKKPVSDPAFE